MGALQRKGVDACLRKIIGSYLRNRAVIIDYGDKQEDIRINCGVPQGSVLGPLLWSILFDELLEITMTEGVITVAYVNDLATVVTAKLMEDLKDSVGTAVGKITEWLESKHLSLAAEKTEAVMLTRRRVQELSFTVDDVVVWIDKELKFKQHIFCIAEKAEELMSALTRLMPRVRGRKAGKRRTLCDNAQSMLLYAAPVWSSALRIQAYTNTLAKVQRIAAIRICGAYRTISREAVLVIAGVIPIELLANERKRLFEINKEEDQHNKNRNRKVGRALEH